MRPATLLKSDSSKGIFLLICKVSKKTYFVEHCFWISLVLGVYFPFWNLIRGGGRV